MRKMTALIISTTLMLGVSACGEDADLNQSANALNDYYATHPPARGWTVNSVSPDLNSGKLIVEVLVTSQKDVDHIKTLSRMEQFAIAKLPCPTMTPELRAAISEDTRVWIHLKSEKAAITSSICPH